MENWTAVVVKMRHDTLHSAINLAPRTNLFSLGFGSKSVFSPDCPDKVAAGDFRPDICIYGLNCFVSNTVFDQTLKRMANSFHPLGQICKPFHHSNCPCGFPSALGSCLGGEGLNSQRFICVSR